MATRKLLKLWFPITPARFVTILPIIEAAFWLSQKLPWASCNAQKGWAVLIAVAIVPIASLSLLLWLSVALLFRSPFQFGIRSLVVLTVAVGIPSSWLEIEREHARQQQTLVEDIRRLGGIVSYDWEIDMNGDPLPGSPRPPGPATLRNLLGVDFFADVLQVSLSTRNVTNDWMKRLSGAPRLQELDLSYTHVTDDGLEPLKTLSQLKTLSLACTEVTDSGLENLRGLTRLQSLNIPQTEITDIGLEKLSELKQLQHLDIGGTMVTDSGLSYLQRLTKLRTLRLYVTNVTDAGIEKFNLSLPDCDVSR